MSRLKKVVIAGAGLAGLTSAIHLSLTGHEVIIVEKNEFPKHKVCGEYISNEVLPYLKWLGVNPEELNPSQITKINFSTSSGKSISTDLPLGGFGISRYSLDYFLYQKAVNLNCKFVHETVTDIDFLDNEFLISLSNNEIIKAEIAIGAFGKRSNIDQKFHRKFITKKSSWLAVKGHFKGDFPNDVVGLHNFRGGYCGVSKVENSFINICYLADIESFKKYKNIEEYERDVVCKNPILKSILTTSKPVFDKPMTISQISFDKKNCVENHMLMIGDTAGLIHPLCGNGMAMAIHSAKIVSEIVTKYYNVPEYSREKLEADYKKQWNEQFKSRLKTGRLLGSLLQMQNISEIMIKFVALFPSLLPKIIKRTHGKLISVPQ